MLDSLFVGISKKFIKKIIIPIIGLIKNSIIPIIISIIDNILDPLCISFLF